MSLSLVDYQSSSDESEDETKSASKKIAKEPVKSIGKKKEPVKITIPIIDEEEDISPVSSKSNKVKTISGLLGLLPPPKYSSSEKIQNKKTALVPHVLTKKPESTKSKVLVKKSPAISNANSTENSSSANSAKNDDSETDDGLSDFFSLQSSDDDLKGISLPPPKHNSYSTLPAAGSSETVVTNSSSTVSNQLEQPSTVSHFENPSANDNLSYDETNEESVTGSFLPITDANTKSNNLMTDEGFLRLQGKKRGFEQINIIDVNINEELADKVEWMKALTQEKQVHSRKKVRMPTSTQKRKHQITYLAFQAKERELDLKNQWSHNRLTKRETQAKYGF